MRTCRSWLWSSFSWDSSVRYQSLQSSSVHDKETFPYWSRSFFFPFFFRAISRDLHLFLKRPSQSSTAGTVLSIRWLFLRSGGLARPSFSPPRPPRSGLAFCSTSELQGSFARTEEGSLGLAAGPAACCWIFWWGEATTKWLLLSIIFFSLSHPIQPFASLVKEEILVAT